MICKSCNAKWRIGNKKKTSEFCPVCGCFLEMDPKAIGFSDIKEMICFTEHLSERDQYWNRDIFLAAADSFFEIPDQMHTEISMLFEQDLRKSIEQWRSTQPTLESIKTQLRSYRLPFSVERYAEDLHYVFGNVYDPGDDTESAAFFLSYAEKAEFPAYELQALMRAGQLGSAEAAIKAAKGLEKGKYGKKDHHTELFVLKNAENSGNPEVMYQLGRMYRLGWGTPADTDAAQQYFQKAADSGYTKAEYQLAVIDLENGNMEEGLKYLTSAANKDYMPAKFDLAERLILGDGPEQNQEEGVRLLKECARSGNMEANDMLIAILR